MRASFGQAIDSFQAAHSPLPGIADDARRSTFIEQLVESARRNEYFTRLTERAIGPRSSDPTSTSFDPLRAAIRHNRDGSRDEAFWMVFLFVHFGKHRLSGWQLAADIYGGLGDGPLWTWDRVSADVASFRAWLGNTIAKIESREPHRGFGNHRKYESLDAASDGGTGAVVESYVDWVGPERSHDALIEGLLADCGGIRTDGFQAMYRSIGSVRRFGRTASFDYCATVSKLGLADIEPGMAFLDGSTGPLTGARMLICEPGHEAGPLELESVLAPLRAELVVGFDALEDALCNWQKSPAEFKPFRG
jgi:hypothetical protein